MHIVMQVSVRRASGLPQDPEPSENVVSFVRALAGLQVPPDVLLRAEELANPGADMRRLLRCIMFLKNSEEVIIVNAPMCNFRYCTTSAVY